MGFGFGAGNQALGATALSGNLLVAGPEPLDPTWVAKLGGRVGLTRGTWGLGFGEALSATGLRGPKPAKVRLDGTDPWVTAQGFRYVPRWSLWLEIFERLVARGQRKAGLADVR